MDRSLTHKEKLTSRVREALAGTPSLVEKRMFGGVGFMVNGKMCLCVKDSAIICRVDSLEREELIRKKGCRPMTMGGREYKSYIRVEKTALQRKDDLHYWIGVALEFNDRIKAIPRVAR